jgi:PadR family transcriptional regulator PadR
MIYTGSMKETPIPSDLLRGHTDTIILRLLLDGDKYGYAITKLVYDRSEKTYELKEATMYSSLRRLENEGYISSYWGDESQGGRRKYYRISDTGRDLYVKNKSDWEAAKHILDRLLYEKGSIV